MSQASVSVIIPSYNREVHLVNSIKDVLQQDYDNFTLVVVDQTLEHEPATRDYLNEIKQHPKVNYIFSEIPGVTRAKNTGLKAHQADYYIIIDDDVKLTNNFIHLHIDEMQRLEADALQGRIIEEGATTSKQPQWVNYWLKYSGSNNSLVDGPTNTLTCANCSISHKVLEKVGYFDENFYQTAIFEDADYGRRIAQAGLKLMFSAKAELFHYRVPTGGVESNVKKNIKFDESYYANQQYYAYKHLDILVRTLFLWRLKRRIYKASRRLLKSALNKANHMLEQ